MQEDVYTINLRSHDKCDTNNLKSHDNVDLNKLWSHNNVDTNKVRSYDNVYTYNLQSHDNVDPNKLRSNEKVDPNKLWAHENLDTNLRFHDNVNRSLRNLHGHKIVPVVIISLHQVVRSWQGDLQTNRRLVRCIQNKMISNILVLLTFSELKQSYKIYKVTFVLHYSVAFKTVTYETLG